MPNSRGPAKSAVLAMVAGTLLAAACTSPIKRAEEFAAQEDWLAAVMEYRKAYAARPGDVDYKSRLKQAELKAADFYYQRGQQLLLEGDLDGAIVQFQRGLVSMPEHTKVQQAMADALARKEGLALYEEALGLHAAGKNTEARQRFAEALEQYPHHEASAKALAALDKEMQLEQSEGFALPSTAPISLNFRQTDLKQAFEFLAKSFGVNVIFDEAVKSVPVTLFARDLAFEQGLNLLLATSRTFHKQIGPNTLLIAPDTKEKRGQYEDHLVRTFQLNIIRAKEMADILKGVMTVKKLTGNDALNTLVIRDTAEVITLAARIIEDNDRKPAEIILDVEILEVNRTKAERLGLDLGSYAVVASIPAPGTVPVSGSIRDTVEATATLTLPSATLRLFKQDVDAEILANPKVRALSGTTARIHIGDRVPLRAATILDATGQTRTTFEYRDIGIRLSVEPTVHLDNSARVKLGLEVSALGENLGTANEPAFRIGTRNAETVMLLRDGETAILGGLIREEERNTRVKVPWLGDIPVIGPIFTSYDDSEGRTDVLLTITPRVVRGWDLSARSSREFYSGTENVYSDKPLFAGLNTPRGAQVSLAAAAGGAVSIGEGTSEPAAATASLPLATESTDAEHRAQADAASPGATSAPTSQPAPAAGEEAASPLLMFSEAAYEVANGQVLQVMIVGSRLPPGTAVPLEILYNPQLLSFVSAAQGEVALNAFDATADSTRGVMRVKLQLGAGASTAQGAVLGRITLRGEKPGVSYLVYRAPIIRNEGGDSISAQLRASRIVVR